MHVAPHNGYSIKKTREFVIKYGPYLRTTLKIAQVLFKLGSFIIPQLDSVSETVGSDTDTILLTPDKQNEMEQQLNFVEKLLDRVDHKWAQSKSTMLGYNKLCGVPLQVADLREVETYLDVDNNKRSLGNLYRTVTIDGHVRWVCLEHYDDISFNNAMFKYIDQLEAMGGKSVAVNHININTKWKQHGITIAGGSGYGNQINQLSCPRDIYVDDDRQTIYIADGENNRIVQWKYGAKNGQIVAGGNAKGDRSDQLNEPTGKQSDVITKEVIRSRQLDQSMLRIARIFRVGKDELQRDEGSVVHSNVMTEAYGDVEIEHMGPRYGPMGGLEMVYIVLKGQVLKNDIKIEINEPCFNWNYSVENFTKNGKVIYFQMPPFPYRGYETVKANIIILYKGEELFQSPYLYKGSLDQVLAELSLNELPPTTTSSSSSSLVAAMPKVDNLKWLFDTNAHSNSRTQRKTINKSRKRLKK
ncbi:unnamed protein product [Adineta steineri]|uniref:Uncharacterized protein n=2 Tax=Adineta steineri TaxID=433720 RepID=A0A814I587_9BILA|nr:unnamed protein product [Adineta steineri]